MTINEMAAVESPQIPVLDFSDRLAIVRRHTGLSQAAFAERIGVPKGSIGAWEKGVVPSKPKQKLVANSIQTEFGYSAKWIVGAEQTTQTVTRQYLSANTRDKQDATVLPFRRSSRKPAA